MDMLPKGEGIREHFQGEGIRGTLPKEREQRANFSWGGI
jgi:hypothetical protein